MLYRLGLICTRCMMSNMMFLLSTVYREIFLRHYSYINLESRFL